MTVISSLLTFPNISWWAQVMKADIVLFDKAEHFQKMTSRNRYDIAGANNRIKLSVPLVNGRNQHVPMRDVQIYNEAHWQTQHWRTLVSVYKRSPYFDHYEGSLKPLFGKTFTHLTDLNMASIEWVRKQLQMKFEIREATVFVKDHGKEVTDLRNYNNSLFPGPIYHQVFEDRIGFLPDLSILDLLFSEGPLSVDKLL